MQDAIRVAVLGAGSAAQVVHLPILKRLRQVDVVGLVDVQGRTARTIAERFDVPNVAADLDGLAKEVEFDAVLVCLPNHAHEFGVLEALKHGAHVLCERPLSVSRESASRLVEAADGAGRQLLVANNHRFRYDVRAIRHFVSSGELGGIQFVRSTWLNRRSARPRRGWRREMVHEGGGALMDLGAQAIDMALWTVDYPDVQRVRARTWGRAGAVETGAVVQLGLADGIAVTVELTWELADERDHHQLYVLGSGGTADSQPFRITRRVATGIVDVTPPTSRRASALYADSYRQEWAEFLRFVRGDKPIESQTDQVVLASVLDACYRSADENREIELTAS
ncbi:MAG: Gfo/Idh/MocA family oxidoreductase [marine benthic group bacterium]|jgi:predicted dehydrogenase|nr:Gfo/Idh/MocA family oxidoreductase [Candidatus Carthagonibacter metallireducens]MCL7965364.1 Gfo/Idh/MocA family oxidoreductase [Gemmatimonadota bacterium]MCL7980417.1 Gfo/Idh/MocA family oxidoreductase [Gemmatimonadota bacterium]MCL7981230.1 Gfo/Idh/MocA family oxidoreductase [Gemmatimonadota bacterium]MCL7986052.1 Gfo/Idh/MocA family oxidoreductase [Gemmatimonadota bacterium]